MTHPDTDLLQVDNAAVLRLADHMTRVVHGYGIGHNMADGRLALLVASRKHMLEYAAAALSCPGFTYTGEDS